MEHYRWMLLLILCPLCLPSCSILLHSRVGGPPVKPASHMPPARRCASLKRKLSGNPDVTTPPPPPHATPRPAKQQTGKGGAKRIFPEALKGMASRAPQGRRICWDYNLPDGCPNAAGSCPNGDHVCMRKGCFKSQLFGRLVCLSLKDVSKMKISSFDVWKNFR